MILTTVSFHIIKNLIDWTCIYYIFANILDQYLASQFEDADDSMTLHPRARRDEDAAVADKDKCHKRHHFKFCCAEEALKKIHDEDKQLKKECFKQVTGKDKREFFHSDPFKCDKEKIEKAKNEINVSNQNV